MRPPRSTVIETQSGGYLDLLDPDPENIRLLDIGRGLSRAARFSGQTSRYYSVAEHAVVVANRLLAMNCSMQTALLGLHHDDAEAFIGDVTRPLKLQLASYHDIESKMQEACLHALGLVEPDVLQYEAIEEADNWALSQEAYLLLPSRGAGWFSDGLWKPGDGITLSAGEVPEYAAFRAWMNMHDRLRYPTTNQGEM